VEYEADAFNRESEKTTATEPRICEFCSASLSGPVIRCNDCGAILTISDLDLVFSPNTVNIEAITNRVEELVAEGCNRELSKDELVWLGFGYLNLADIDAAIAGFQEAARLDPDDVVFAAEVNALHIRHKEFKKHDLAEIEEEPAVEEPKRLILVVDDSATVRKLISGKLSDAGHEVFCAADGKEALEQLKALKPDLVLLDIAMPKMDGYEVCRKIRSTPETREIPVIMISGKDGVFDEDRGRLAGSSGFITKPFGPETLMSTVASYLGTETPVVAA
jgi:twitching motility two-component system response regulator PilG